jgi:hypothetical protein
MLKPVVERSWLSADREPLREETTGLVEFGECGRTGRTIISDEIDAEA